jgi:hypothetical protein
LQQAAHPQVVCGQALGDVTEHAIAGNHFGGWGGSAAGQGQSPGQRQRLSNGEAEWRVRSVRHRDRPVRPNIC